MQTFLPVADFEESARLLDSPRLGKQRVETLQILRAIELPDDVRARLLHHLGVARSAVRTASRAGDPAAVAAARARVQAAKTGLGERGPAWWEQDAGERAARWTAALRDLDG